MKNDDAWVAEQLLLGATCVECLLHGSVKCPFYAPTVICGDYIDYEEFITRYNDDK
jgi:hypothetical protein